MLFLIPLFLFSCKPQVEIKDIKLEETPYEQPPPPPPVHPSSVKVKAYLIYNDGTTSNFDILNDKSKALWNVIIGAGDAEKPSEKIKLVLSGTIDSIDLNVKNGKNSALTKRNLSLSVGSEFIIKNTGCEEVSIKITKQKIIIFKDSISFRCGE